MPSLHVNRRFWADNDLGNGHTRALTDHVGPSDVETRRDIARSWHWVISKVGEAKWNNFREHVAEALIRRQAETMIEWMKRTHSEEVAVDLAPHASRNFVEFMVATFGHLGITEKVLPHIAPERDGGIGAYWRNNQRSLFMVFPGEEGRPITFSGKSKQNGIYKGQIFSAGAVDLGLRQRIFES